MNDRGFTLVEILVAIVLFSILLLPLTGMLIAESRFQERHERKTTAMLVAKNEIAKSIKASGNLESKEYTVTMAARVWNVSRLVETEEGAIIDTLAIIKKTFVTVRVTRENDTVRLAEFRVLRETYK
jgi:prepilin-type N-terminal cleavage/methylation domain-containing protein